MTAARKPPDGRTAPATDWRHPAHAAFDLLVTRGPVLVAVATCFPDVAPPRFQSAPHVALRFGRQLSPPVQDFSWDGSGIVGTLAFGDERFTCRIPWVAVVGIRSDIAERTVTPESRRHLSLVP